MLIDHDDLAARIAVLANRFKEIHSRRHMAKAGEVSDFLRAWSTNTRSITTRENICQNLLPMAVESVTKMYPQYGSEIGQILQTILIDEDIDWIAMTDQLSLLIADYSLKSQHAKSSAPVA